MDIRGSLVFGLLIVTQGFAQIRPPNDKGAALGNLHLNVRDMEAQRQFWSVLGGTVNPKGRLVQFPGVYLVLRQQEPTGGTVGSGINHFGFHVRNLDDWLSKWTEAKLKFQRNKDPKIRQLFVFGPDDIKIEIIEDVSIREPIEMHHIHLFVPDPAEAQSWYVKVFGAVAGNRKTSTGIYATATIPGAEFIFTKSDAQARSRGRSVDDIGIEIKNIDKFVTELGNAGVAIEAPVRPSTGDLHLRVTHITDPWGTRFELTEGFPGNLAFDSATAMLAQLVHLNPIGVLVSPGRPPSEQH
jgi:catechol 2,3-dioxygenase-like lactoylglutathione lyase family enzyme